MHVQSPHRRSLPLLLGLMLALLLHLACSTVRLQSHPQPVATYTEALERIAILRSQDSGAANPVGELQFLTHNQQTEKAIIFVHGYTNCPQQFKSLGEYFFALGYNVLIAPLPHHGLADRLTKEHAKLKAEELAVYGDQVVDIGQGLGKYLVMAGLSAGGNVTAWAAQYRSDLDLAVVMAPVLGYKQFPATLTPAVTRLFRTLPNFFCWWNPALKTDSGVPHSYPRFSTRALAETLRLGLAVRKAAQRYPPAAARILMVTNANDASVHPIPISQLTDYWRSRGADIRTYEFAADLQLNHDFIDPGQHGAHPELVYPKLIELITQNCSH